MLGISREPDTEVFIDTKSVGATRGDLSRAVVIAVASAYFKIWFRYTSLLSSTRKDWKKTNYC